MARLPIFLGVILFFAAAAHADEVYFYSGNALTGDPGCNCSIGGDFITVKALGPNTPFSTFTPLMFSFTAGSETFSSANAVSSTFLVITDDIGNPMEWEFKITNSDHETITSVFLTGSGEDLLQNGSTDVAKNIDRPGNWTSAKTSTPGTSGVPEPPALWCLALGLALLGLAFGTRRGCYGRAAD